MTASPVVSYVPLSKTTRKHSPAPQHGLTLTLNLVVLPHLVLWATFPTLSSTLLIYVRLVPILTAYLTTLTVYSS